MAAPAQHSAEPERLYRIGDVSRLTDTKPFVLRFWETEFPMLQPVKTPKGHRLYRQEDIDLILTIKRLLYQEGFTIPGARRHLAEQTGEGATIHAASLSQETSEQPALFPPVPLNEPCGEDSAHVGRGTVPQSQDTPAATAATLGAGNPAEAATEAGTAPCLPANHSETLRAVRDELRAILTLLGAG